jgi:hypothetical protein
MVVGSHEAVGAGCAEQDRGAVASSAAERAARAGWGLGAASIHWGKRPTASRPVAVTRRDRDLLALLHDVNYLPASQMALLGWGGNSTCARRRLRLLHDHGLIDKSRIAHTSDLAFLSRSSLSRHSSRPSRRRGDAAAAAHFESRYAAASIA